MKKFKFLSLSVLVLTVVLGSAFSPRFATQYFTYSGSNEFLPGNYTSAGSQSVIPGANNQLAWIEVDDTEVYPAGHADQFKPMVDNTSTTIRATLNIALTSPKSDQAVSMPVVARVQLKP
ncbi:hypothetical protein D3H65_01140 [Paraflavitalea soli]|uniref:Uncharacterized protein n=1 Tax=Paraflavitalea soli TaxID=2315862 RepID=A0A3B7MEF2_9BACT|nr:hypothetical protein [Paraflavitalea soli]AXY72662.1 hypothetical protein D3H65_01140 [Paraflavitalea soli]